MTSCPLQAGWWINQRWGPVGTFCPDWSRCFELRLELCWFWLGNRKEDIQPVENLLQLSAKATWPARSNSETQGQLPRNW